jgi:hypothetical protein
VIGSNGDCVVAGRYLIPTIFLTVLVLVIGNGLFLAADPASSVAWWINQEVYARLRGLIYLVDDAELPPAFAILIAVGIASLCYLARQRAFVCFAANHGAAVGLFYAAFTNFSVKAAALGAPAPLHLILVMNWDWPMLVAILAALISCIPCHLDYLSVAIAPDRND